MSKGVKIMNAAEKRKEEEAEVVTEEEAQKICSFLSGWTNNPPR